MSHANFVSTDWLDAHLGDPDLRVIDASWHMPTTARKGDAEFRQGHIPGAVFFNIDEIAEVHPWFHGDQKLVLRDGTEIGWSRRYAAKRPDLLR